MDPGLFEFYRRSELMFRYQFGNTLPCDTCTEDTVFRQCQESIGDCEKMRKLIWESETLPIVPYAVILWQYFEVEDPDGKQEIHDQPVYVQAQMLFAYSKLTRPVLPGVARILRMTIHSWIPGETWTQRLILLDHLVDSHNRLSSQVIRTKSRPRASQTSVRGVSKVALAMSMLLGTAGANEVSIMGSNQLPEIVPVQTVSNQFPVPTVPDRIPTATLNNVHSNLGAIAEVININARSLVSNLTEVVDAYIDPTTKVITSEIINAIAEYAMQGLYTIEMNRDNMIGDLVLSTNGAHTEVELLLNVVTIGSENRFISPMFNIIRGIVEEVLPSLPARIPKYNLRKLTIMLHVILSFFDFCTREGSDNRMIRTTPEEVQKTLTVLNYLDPREDPHRHRDFSQTVNLMIDSINNHADVRSMSETLNTMLKDLEQQLWQAGEDRDALVAATISSGWTPKNAMEVLTSTMGVIMSTMFGFGTLLYLKHKSPGSSNVAITDANGTQDSASDVPVSSSWVGTEHTESQDENSESRDEHQDDNNESRDVHEETSHDDSLDDNSLDEEYGVYYPCTLCNNHIKVKDRVKHGKWHAQIINQQNRYGMPTRTGLVHERRSS